MERERERERGGRSERMSGQGEKRSRRGGEVGKEGHGQQFCHDMIALTLIPCYAIRLVLFVRFMLTSLIDRINSAMRLSEFMFSVNSRS